MSKNFVLPSNVTWQTNIYLDMLSNPTSHSLLQPGPYFTDYASASASSTPTSEHPNAGSHQRNELWVEDRQGEYQRASPFGLIPELSWAIQARSTKRWLSVLSRYFPTRSSWKYSVSTWRRPITLFQRTAWRPGVLWSTYATDGEGMCLRRHVASIYSLFAQVGNPCGRCWAFGPPCLLS